MFCTECGKSLPGSPKFCSSCGAKILLEGDSNLVAEEWSPFVHAYNAVFQENVTSIDQITDYGTTHEQEILSAAHNNDSEALLRLTLIHCCFENNFAESPVTGELAMSAARASGKDLGRYWFAYGFALQQVERFDEAIDAFTESLECNFGEAALNLGQLTLSHNADLANAVKYWRLGRDNFKSFECDAALKEAETDDEVYSATVQLKDGSYDVIMYSDRPGGLGKMKR